MRLSAGVSQVACRHRRSLALVGSLAAFAPIAVVLAGRWDEFLRALGGAPVLGASDVDATGLDATAVARLLPSPA